VTIDRQRVAELYANFNEAHGQEPGDWGEAMREFFDPEVEIVPPGEYIDVGELRGYDGLEAWQRMIANVFETWRYELHDVLDVDDERVMVLLTLHLRGKSSGAEMTNEGGHLLQFRHDRVLRLEVFRDHAEALAAAGLEPR
jgi:ketosteroid isomerase-like protein